MSQNKEDKVQVKLSEIHKKEVYTAWRFALPAILLLALFLLIPFIVAFVLSFTNQRLITNPNLPTQFIGFRNYIRLLNDF